MFRRRRSRARRAKSVPRRRERQRRLSLEPLEDRRLLAVVSVSNTLDVANAPDLSSITALINDDGGDGISLREAITAANNTGGADEIRFNDLPAGVQTITLGSLLPDVTDTVTIDGYVNRAGAIQNTLPAGQGLDSVLEIVITDGAAIDDGLRITGTGANGSIIRGLVINGFDDDGIQISDSNNNLIQGNYLGTNAAGNAPGAGGNDFGVFVTGTSDGNVIGGTTAASRNLISGNNNTGIFTSPTAGSTTVQGNLIGTNRAGTGAVANGEGILVSGGSAVIGGSAAGTRNVISGNSAFGVSLNAVTGATVQGNVLGLDVNGAALPNTTHGVFIANNATMNTIGGTTAEARNIISGNGGSGVQIDDSDSNTVLGNFIGTSLDGTAARPNTDGVVILNGSSSNTIGGTAAGSRNVISGNNTDGVRIEGAGTSANMVFGNFIGTNADGDAALGNGDDGVEVSGGATNNRIGDNAAGARNVISANGDEGVEIADAGTSGNFVQSNFIGTAADGTSDLGNTNDGVDISNGAANNLVGGTDPGDGNTIAFNGDGVVVDGNASTGNKISRNSIFSNDDLGIDLDDDGPTGNDGGDGDIGPNLRQNFPQFVGDATLLANSIALRYFVNSADGANATYPLTIEFFIADADNQEGRTFLAADTYAAADAQQVKMITIPLPAVLTNAVFVATATDAAGNTSEFSAPLEIAAPVILGSEPTVILTNQLIGQDDVDFYQYIAHSTGKLIVRIDFLHALGDLDLEVRDQFGNLIAMSNSSSFDQNFEQVIIPVVGQETYFISVIAVDFGDKQLQSYSVEVENFPAPVPAPPDLATASDTGMMNDDNITADNTPTFRIQADLADFANMGIALLNAATIDPNGDGNAADSTDDGAGVFVTLVNLDTGAAVSGFADRIGTSTTAWTFTVGAPLADGEYFVSAAVQIVDGADPRATGRSQLSPPLTIVVDATPANVEDVAVIMLEASDSGMFDDDHVTNKMQPAFQGIAPVGAKVRLFANGELVGQTIAGSDTSDVDHPIDMVGGQPDDGLGLWEITVEPLRDNGYDITLVIEDAAGNLLNFDPHFNGPNQPIDIVIDTLEPNTPYLDLLDDTGRHDNDNVTKENMPRVTMTSTDPNAALAQILFQDNLKFRIYDRYENTAEFLLYDSALDAIVDAVDFAGDMFTALTFIEETLPEQFFALVGTNGAVIDVGGVGKLADGVHNFKLEVEDRAGNISHDFLLEITVDTVTPPVAFGLPDGLSDTDGLTAASDTGVTTVPDTYADRVTSDTTPTLWGRAEADSIVRLYLDRNGNGVIDLTTDPFLGQTTAIPLDGNDAYPDGYWEITSALDLNQLVGLPKDGLRQLLATAEDVAGNPMPMTVDKLPVIDDGVAALQIFIDTQGPQITDVNLGPEFDYDLFDPKPSEDGPTPLVHSLFIDVRDLPFRLDQAGTINDFLYPALVEEIAAVVGNYDLVGDYVGRVVIQQVIVHFQTVVSGDPAFASIELVFAEPLPDDRYTLTVRDHLVDPAGNRLDGESGADDPSDNPIFPTGDGVPGGDFVARFTIDSRPEIGVWAAGIIHIDTNGNFHFDPENVDFTNRDLIYTLGFSSDYIFAGNFVRDAEDVADGFDKLAVYGRVGDTWRFLVDFDNDGVPDEEFLAPAVNGIPVAGNFDGDLTNGDEVGVFTGSAWFFDTNHDFVVDDGFATDYAGFPVAGDFDNDGDDDVATYIASQAGGNQFHIDLNTAGLGAPISIDGSADFTFRVGLPGLGTFGFPGVRERPVAADMNADGADDLGLWVPDGTAILPGDQGEWFFLLSDFQRDEKGGGVFVTETIIDRIIGGGDVDFVPFSTTPFGSDLYARFGNSFALPIVGNFDPPATSESSATQRAGSSPTPITTPTSKPVTSQSSTTQRAGSSPTPTSTPPTSTTATAAAKVAVPAVTAASSTAKTTAKTTTSITSTKAAKKLAVPAIQPKTTKAVAAVTTTTKTAKANTKAVTPVVVPTVKTAAKVTKVTTKTTKKSSAAAPPVPAVLAKTTTTQKSLAPSTSKKKPKTPPVATVTPSSNTPPPQPLMFAAAPVTHSVPPAAARPVFAQPVVAPAVTAPSVAGSFQVSTLSSTLEIVAPKPADPIRSTGFVLGEPAIADAAVTDLRLTLADVTTDTDAIAADRLSQPPQTQPDDGRFADAELALALAWDSVSFGIQ